MTYPAFGSTLSLRATVLSTDEFVVGDKAADPTGNTGVRVPATALLFKNGSGNVALGTNTAATRLHIAQSIDGEIMRLRREGSTNNPGFFFYVNEAGSFAEIQASSSTGTQLRLGTDGVSRWLIESGGSFRPFGDGVNSIGTAAYRASVIYASSGSINTSDEREKTDISAIPEQWLDAWGLIEWSRFKFVDGARWHIGLVAQRVHAAFAKLDLDAFEIGLCCFNTWDEEREPIYELVSVSKEIDGENVEIEEQIDTGKTRQIRAGGDRWGLRYEECLAIEAAWQRRELTRMAERNATLEERLAALEAQS